MDLLNKMPCPLCRAYTVTKHCSSPSCVWWLCSSVMHSRDDKNRTIKYVVFNKFNKYFPFYGGDAQ